MGAAKKVFDKKQLRDFVPLNALSPMHIDEVAKKAVIEEVRAGRYIFKQGDRDNFSIYVLEGEVNILDGDGTHLGSIQGGSDAAHHPIGHQQPRQVSARAKTKVTIIRIDSSLLDVLLTWDESAGYEVSEIESEDEDDWMTKMLRSPTFMQLPPANIQQLLMKLEQVEAKAGEVVVRQGDEGDYFYVVTSGQCVVSRKASTHGKEVKLAELGEGASFGEEALVSDAKRNASITMLTDGTLMRLAKQDFVELLQNPLVHTLDYAEAKRLVKEGALWLDVRLPGEFENGHIEGALNIPLSGLRDPSIELGARKRHILCCDTGRRSASGAFVLSQRGMDVYVLGSGLQSVPAEDLVTGGGAAALRAPAARTEAEVIPLEPVAEATPSAPAREPKGTAEEQLQEYKARYEKEVARVRGFQESARKTIAAAHQARTQAEEQIKRLTDELEKTRGEAEVAKAALLEAQSAGPESSAEAAELKQQLEKARAAQEQLRGELQDTQERLVEMEARAKALEQQEKSQEASNQELLGQLRSELEQSQAEARSLEEERDALKQQLEQAGEASSSEFEALKARLAEQESGAEAERSRFQALEAELTREVEALQADLAKQRESTGAQASELQEELERLRSEYEELGKRASLLGSERDEARQQLVDVQKRHDALEQELANHTTQTDDRVQQLQDQLNEQTQERETAVARLAELEQAMAESRGRVQELEASQSTRQQEASEWAEREARLQSELDAQRKELQASTDQAQARETELTARVEQQAKELDQAREELEQQREALAQAGRQGSELEQELQAFRQRAEAGTQELTSVRQEAETRIATLERELEAARQAVEEAAGRAESAAQALDGKKAALQEELEGLRQELAGSRDTAAKLETERDALSKTHAEAVAAREALDAEKAQLSEALQSTQDQLAEALAARDAQAAELETLQQQGSRLESELEAAKEAETSRKDSQAEALAALQGQLEAAETARQAAVEELLRLQEEQAEEFEAAQRLRVQLAEQETQLAGLREELAQAAESGDRRFSELSEERDKLLAERDSLRAERDQAQAGSEEAAAMVERLEALETELGSRQETLAETERERNELRSRETALLEEMDKLRAEAEVAQGLADLHAGENADQADQDELRQELQQARQNVDIAVRLRKEAEEGRSRAESELAALQQELATLRSQGDLEAHAVAVPDLGGEEVYEVVAQAVEPAPAPPVGRSNASTVPFDEPEPASRGKGGWLVGILAGAVLGAAAAGGAFFMLRAADVPPAEVAKALEEESAAVGAEGQTQPAAERSPAPATPAPVEPKPEPKPKPKPKPAAETSAVPPGPVLREFSDALKGGVRGPTMVALRAARFEMGSGASSPNFDERPRHEVALKSFAVSKYEVTFEQYDRFARATGRRRPADEGWGRGKRPVINVSWEDAQAYTRWLSEQTGQPYRLLTEAEWEYAARGGSDDSFWWGARLKPGKANCFDCGSAEAGAKTAPVGSYEANGFGLFDTAGNVEEWVGDCYVDSYARAPTDGSAVQEAGCEARVIRGGGFTSAGKRLRSASRDRHEPEGRLDHLGFRVARDL
jgi:formylglycine-generating enzyme required for sulfatase activity/CRP-like cAMP-binding protein/chromosome segregation ATPase